MKMSFVKKLLVRVYWVFSVIALLALLVACCFRGALTAFGNNAGLLAVGIIFIVGYILLAVAMGMMLFAKKPGENDEGFITVESLDTGKVKVSLAAVDQMIRQAAKGVEGTSEMKADIENNGDSVSISTSVIVRNGLHIPTVTANMQNAIRGYIERNCGVAVREVSVSVRLVDDGESEKRGRRKPAFLAQLEQRREAHVQDASCADMPAEEIDVEEILTGSVETEVEDSFDDEIALTLDPCAEDEAADEAESLFDAPEEDAEPEEGVVEETEIKE